MRRPFLRFPFVLVPVFVLGTSCHYSWGPGAGPGSPQEIAYILLIDQAGNDYTAHLPLYPAAPETLQVRPYRADRTRITAIDGSVSMRFTFTPASIATVAAVADSLTKVVTAADTVGTSGTFMVTMRFPPDTLVKTFGPFTVLIH